MIIKKSCGFDKWSMELDTDNGCITVEFNHYPNFGTVKLYDLLKSDLIKLADMFNEAAKQVDHDRECNCWSDGLRFPQRLDSEPQEG